LDLDGKVRLLADSARFDLCGSCFGQPSRKSNPQGGWIYPVSLPDGRVVKVLKILLSNDCVHDCFYCANRAGSPFRRTSLKAEELVALFLRLWQKGLVKGLFLSSAVSRDPTWTMNEMLKTVEMLRKKFHFRGYIHLKILPEATRDYIEEAVRLATRVSVNLEAPSPHYLSAIAPQKSFSRIMGLFSLLSDLRRKGLCAPAGITTQFVVGGSTEKDREILGTAFLLYRKFCLARVYYSAFQPVWGTPFSGRPAVSSWREVRLYQVDYLLRRYQFSLDEIYFSEDGNLPLDQDPKTLWALRHPEFFPVEVNKASLGDLLKVPGIGPLSARRIVEARKKGKIADISSLKKMGIRVKKALPFLLIDGKKPCDSGRKQLFLFC